MKLERRVVTVGNLEVRQLDDGRREYRGDAIRFGEPSENLGGFIEYVDADCEILSEDVRHLINHDPNLVLGRTTAGTTRLDRSGQAVGVSTDMPDTSYARDLEISIERRDVTQMSFGFRKVDRSDGTPGDTWDFTQSPAVRHLRAIELSDVSTVTYPAYPTTTAEVRSLVASHVRSIGPAVVGWDSEDGMSDYMDDVSESLPAGFDGEDYAWGYCADATTAGDSALVVWYDNGDCDLYVVPVSLDETGEPVAGDQSEWVEVEWQLVVAAGDDDMMRSVRAGLERRAGKALSAENAGHVQAISDAVDGIGSHLQALQDAAGLSDEGEGDDNGNDGGGDNTDGEGYNSRPSDAELRLYEALEGIMYKNQPLNDRV